MEGAPGSTTRVEHEQVQRTPFDRRAALEELERFGRDIERYRAQRKALGEEFETFIRSFETPPGPATAADAAPARDAAAAVPPVAAPVAAAASVPAAPPVAAPPATPVSAPASAAVLPPAPPVVTAEPAEVVPPLEHPGVAAADAVPPPAAPAAPVDPVSWSWVAPDVIADADAVPERTEDAGAAIALESPPAPRTRSPLLIPTALAAGAVVVVAGILLSRSSSRAPAPTPPAVVTAPATAPAAAPVPAPSPAPPAAAAAVPATGSEISTIRRVWMRVIVDGARVVEREVPAGTTLPLNAEKTIVIRTGDAGAVRLTIRGQAPAFLGAEGEVVTRSFTVPPRSAPAR